MVVEEISSHVLRPNYTSNLVHRLALGTPKFYIALYGKIKHELVNLSSNCDVKSGLSGETVLSDKASTRSLKCIVFEYLDDTQVFLDFFCQGSQQSP